MKNLKETLKPKEAIIILDFTENSFVLQDAVQRYRWNNSHATLHPFADYYRGDEGQLCNTNICVISGCHKHDVVAVHSYLKVVLKKFTSDTSHRISKIYYFTDGAASQYKNYKNICNLLYHRDDFGLDAEWHFFATSHGKNACDGIGGTVKREASNASLRATTSGHILTPLQLFEWCSMHLTELGSVIFRKIKQSTLYLTARFKRRHTKFQESVVSIVLFLNRIRNSKWIGYQEPKPSVMTWLASLQLTKVSNISQVEEYSLGQFILCRYDEDWWVGSIRDISFENEDALVALMHPKSPCENLYWLIKVDTC